MSDLYGDEPKGGFEEPTTAPQQSEPQEGFHNQAESETPPPEKKKPNWLLIIFFVLLAALAGEYVYIKYFKKTDTNPNPQQTTTTSVEPTATSSEEPTEVTTTPTSTSTTTLKTYTDNSWGFSFEYPAMYQTVNDTYGWPHALVHLMPVTGGQSYEGQVEWWDSENGFKDTYKTDPKFVIAHPNGKNWITINYYADPNEIWQGIIDSFKFK